MRVIRASPATARFAIACSVRSCVSSMRPNRLSDDSTWLASIAVSSLTDLPELLWPSTSTRKSALIEGTSVDADITRAVNGVVTLTPSPIGIRTDDLKELEALLVSVNQLERFILAEVVEAFFAGRTEKIIGDLFLMLNDER
jgi:hypothetical protein